jgi:hypothetical protein
MHTTSGCERNEKPSGQRTFTMNEDPKVVPLLVLLELFVGDDTFRGHYFHCSWGRSMARPRWDESGKVQSQRTNPKPRFPYTAFIGLIRLPTPGPDFSALSPYSRLVLT